MEGNPIKKIKKIKIINHIIDSNNNAPLGGLNPYSERFDILGKKFYDIISPYINRQTKLLDIGCGTGRLIKQININSPMVKIYGCDINKECIAYCKDQYKGKFNQIDYKHDAFNPNGCELILKLPYKNSQMNVVTILGVINHNILPVIEMIIQEVSRVLDEKGMLIFTALLLNDYSISQIDQKLVKEAFLLNHGDNIEKYLDNNQPHLNRGISESWLRRQLLSQNIIIKEPIFYGDWCNSKNAILGHDLIIAKKGGWDHCNV